MIRPTSNGLRSCLGISLLFLAQLCQARLLGTNSFLFRNLFNRYLPSIRYDLKFVEVSSTADIGYQTIFPLQNGDILPVSSMTTVIDLTIEERKSSFFMKGLSMKYEFYTDSTKTQPETQSDSYDDVAPYTLMGGIINTIPNLQRIGTHKLTISAKSLFGMQIRSQTISWDVFDDSASTSEVSGSSVGVLGELQQWHKITLVFKYGPTISESASPNPFTDYRLDVVFRNMNNSDLVMTVPGYYAADGNAAQTSATAGRVWHCHFAPPAIGLWTWNASFITAPNVALANPGAVAGSTVSPLHGASGSFNILPSDKTGIDLRSKGLLQHIEGKHHLQFIGSGEWFLKTGADSPENFLAYNDFDNTPDNGGLRKSWTPHVTDYETGDPSWKGDKGKGMIGAINYLSAQGMRSFSFLTMNIDGDDKNVYPYVDSSDRLRLDVSKLAQWEIVFEHATTKGMFLHFKTQERENDQLLDGGELGNERKLYYRELIARFGHHLALNWNLGEENTNTVVQLKQFTDWFKLLDPYKHPVVVHNWPTEQESLYGPLYGYPSFDGASLQTDPANVFQDTLDRINDSDAAGHPWVVSNDEQGSGDTGVVPDSADANHNGIRRNVLWGNIMAGGAGVEYYFGYQYENSDLTCEDFRSRANMWVQSRYAVDFFQKNMIPFQDMVNANARVTNNNWCLLERSVGKVMVVYLRQGGTATVDLSGLGINSTSINPSNTLVSVQWYDPRNGGVLRLGTVTSLQLDASQSLGSAPENPAQDWVVLLRCTKGCE